MTKKKTKKSPETKEIKLALNSFTQPDPEGFTRVPTKTGLKTYESDSVDEMIVSNTLEYLESSDRVKLLAEIYRVLKPGSKCLILVPYWSSARAVQDPLIQWPPMCEQSFLYYNKEWRKTNGVEHYPINCDFDFVYGYQVDAALQGRNAEMQQFAIKNYTNAVSALHVTLTKKAQD